MTHLTNCFAACGKLLRFDSLSLGEHVKSNKRETELQPINILQAFDNVSDFWSPKVIGRVNDQYIKVAKLKGQLDWHKHEDEDELFQVLKGQFTMQLEGLSEVTLRRGDFFVVPKGTMHNPVADEKERGFARLSRHEQRLFSKSRRTRRPAVGRLSGPAG